MSRADCHPGRGGCPAPGPTSKQPESVAAFPPSPPKRGGGGGGGGGGGFVCGAGLQPAFWPGRLETCPTFPLTPGPSPQGGEGSKKGAREAAGGGLMAGPSQGLSAWLHAHG